MLARDVASLQQQQPPHPTQVPVKSKEEQKESVAQAAEEPAEKAESPRAGLRRVPIDILTMPTSLSRMGQTEIELMNTNGLPQVNWAGRTAAVGTGPRTRAQTIKRERENCHKGRRPRTRRGGGVEERK